MPDQEPRPTSNPLPGHAWALVLAAGEGSRLQSLTTMKSGVAVPKQFCSLGGGASLLHDALARAASVVAPERACVVVAEHHTQWWRSLAGAMSPENIIVQPSNRGTAIGILLPLLQILQRDAEASLIVLPSDHYVRNEDILASRLRQATAEVARGRDRIVLLGFAPDEADPELGYIVPADKRGPLLRAVSQFVEKPSQASAGKLIDHGGLWNSFIFVARGQALLRTFERQCPEIVNRLRDIVAMDVDPATKQQWLRRVYAHLPSLDFSRDILEKSLDQLEVVTVPACGWSDLGTPRRVVQVLARNESSVLRDSRGSVAGQGFLDLAAQVLLTHGGFSLQERSQ
jgi:mannose-1-phosphate guanylyltransferase